jgi:hypothetical protein
MASLQGRLSSLISAIGADIKALKQPPIVSALPTTGLVDGMEVRLAGDSNTVVWLMKYSTGTGKWHFIGGPPLGWFKQQSQTLDSITSNVYANLPATGAAATLTVPVAGDYMVELCGRADSETNSQTWLSVKRGAAAAVDDDAISFRGGNWSSGSRAWKMTGLTAGQVLLLQAKYVGNITSRLWEASLLLTPIKIG